MSADTEITESAIAPSQEIVASTPSGSKPEPASYRPDYADYVENAEDEELSSPAINTQAADTEVEPPQQQFQAADTAVLASLPQQLEQTAEFVEPSSQEHLQAAESAAAPQQLVQSAEGFVQAPSVQSDWTAGDAVLPQQQQGVLAEGDGPTQQNDAGADAHSMPSTQVRNFF